MSAGQIVGGIVGAVIGFYVGGPVGALQGAALGAGVGGYLDPPKGPTIQGPRLNDLAVQTSTYGSFIPRVYGTVGAHGNILWLENNQLKETVRKKKQGGKGGGGSTTVKTYTYSATTILALCQGPIAGVRRIWCMDKLIYNAGSDDLETIIASNQNAAGWRLYLGTDDQMPDPRYEAEHGVGNVSAFRGIAYIAFYDFQLADYSNTLQAAQFKVEVVSDESDTSVRMIFDETMFIASDTTAPGFFISGSISEQAGEGAYAVDGRESSLSGYICRTSGSVLFDRNYGTSLDLYSSNGYKGCDDHDFAIWLGPLETDTPFLTKNGAVYAGTINKSSGYLIKSRGVNYYFQFDGTVARIAAYTAIAVNSFTISPSRFHAVRDGIVYGVSPDMLTLYTWSASNFTQISSTPITNTAAFTGGTLNINALSYCDGEGLFIAFSNGVVERVVKVDLSTGAASVHIDAGLPPGGNSKGVMRVSDNLYYRLYYGAVSGTHPNRAIFRIFQNFNADSDGVELASVIDTEIGLSGMLDSPDIDVSNISDLVRGYRVQGGSIRSSLEPLQGAFPFDVIPSGYQIKCVPRGQSSVVTIPWEDLGATDGDQSGDILPQSREMDSQLPARTTIKYLDAVREYATSEQYSERINTEAINRVDRDMPLVLTADEAAGVAEVLQNLPWLERTDFSFTLPPTYLALEPSDIVTIEAPQATYQLRITESNYTPDGRLECRAKLNRAALYAPNATGGEGVPPSGTIGLAGESLLVPLDIPVVDEVSQNTPGFVGVMTGYNDGWPGGLAVRSVDDGQTWADLQAYNGKATIGTTQDVLPASDCTLIDQRSLLVYVISGEFESVTRDQMLAGINYAAYGVDGRWEIIRFQNAALQAGGQYIVSGFVRGEKGTEWATGLHEAGDYFILLDDPDNAFIGMAVGSIAVPATYRGVTSGASVDDATDVPFTYQGVNLECLSPVYAGGTRDGSSNFTGTFTRRIRLSSSWWATGVVAPVGEASESYEIDVMDGSTVARTITASTPAFAYSAANQTTDFGSPQASITFRIYQLSATVGRGYPLGVTL